jgi:outer membrane receptor protein involved in Fe transport
MKNAFVNEDDKAAAGTGNKMVKVLNDFDKSISRDDERKQFEDMADDMKENAEHIGANAGKLDNSFAQINPFTGFNSETKAPGYSLLNAGLGGEIISKNRTVVSVFLSANNITDVAYQNHLSRLKYTAINNVTGRQGVYNMGRNFSIKINVPFKL